MAFVLCNTSPIRQFCLCLVDVSRVVSCMLHLSPNMSILPKHFPVCPCPLLHLPLPLPLHLNLPLHLPETSLYFALFAPRLLPINPLPVQFGPHKFLRMLLFCGFLLRLISGLNHPLAPQIWRWGGPGVRRGNDGTRSTKIEDGIRIAKY